MELFLFFQGFSLTLFVITIQHYETILKELK